MLVGARIEVLGPFRLLINGEGTIVGRKKVRDVLVLLACHPAGYRTEALIEALWPEQPPKDPRASLRVTLTRVRSQLGEARDALNTSGGLVSLSCETDALAILDRYSAGGGSLEDGDNPLDQWRGATLAGFEHLPALEPLRAQLDQTHRAIALDFAQAALETGGFADCLTTLSPFEPSTTTDESIATLHSLALARLGRRAEAISALDSFRARLREQGLTATSGLADVEQQVLDETPQASARATSPKPARAVLDELVGRNSELELLASAENPIVIAAEAGAGKSSLLRTAVQDQRAVYVSANMAPTRPLQALTDMVIQIAAQSESPSSAARACLARLEPTHPLAEGIDPPGSRAGLLALAREAVSHFLQHDPAGTVVVDDAQWLDRGTTAVLEELATGPGRLLIGIRTPSPESLSFLDDCDQLVLPPLGVEAIEGLLSRELTHVPASAAAEVHRLSGGNALYASLLVDLLGEGQDPNDLPASILLTVRQRIESLPSGARRLLELASIFDRDAPTDILDDLHPGATHEIALAAQAGLLEAPTPQSARFRHALVRDAIVQMTPSGILTELHDEASHLLEDREYPAGLIAEHAEKGASLDPGRAATWCLRASQELAENFG